MRWQNRLCFGGIVLIVLGQLPGCSGGTGATPFFPQMAAAARTAIVSRQARRAQAQRPPVTRALLDTVEGSRLEVTLERSGIRAYLVIGERRRDGLPGDLVQWRAEDNATLTLRNGVLIATRGLGGDLMSAEAAVSDGTAGPVSGGERALFVRTGDLEVARLALACDLADLGPETVVIVEQAHATRHLRESCTNATGGDVVNDYWVDTRRAVVWQSQQWGGPHVGYVRMRLLIE